MTSELQIDGLRKRIGEVAVLGGITTTLLAGQITAFIGPNGAGKTTLFHAIAGELQPDAGRLLYQGRDITGWPPWRLARLGIGRLDQDVRVFANLSARQNVIAALQRTADRRLLRSLWLGSSRLRAAQGPAEALLDRVGLEGDRDAPAGQLSWGNQKLLAFARLLAGRFRFVLLDEPAAGVSPALRERLGLLIRELSASGVTIALIEHDLGMVRELADAVVLLQEGRVLAQGPAAAVLNQPATLELCLGL
jgi:ABC-type branched-subunit amino acid transport system ATPase component